MLPTTSLSDKTAKNENPDANASGFFCLPFLIFTWAVHIFFCGSQLHKAAAFSAYAAAQTFAAAADVQPMAVCVIGCPLFLGQSGYHILYLVINAVRVKLAEKAFFAEWSHLNLSLISSCTSVMGRPVILWLPMYSEFVYIITSQDLFMRWKIV